MVNKMPAFVSFVQNASALPGTGTVNLTLNVNKNDVLVVMACRNASGFEVSATDTIGSVYTPRVINNPPISPSQAVTTLTATMSRKKNGLVVSVTYTDTAPPATPIQVVTIIGRFSGVAGFGASAGSGNQCGIPGDTPALAAVVGNIIVGMAGVGAPNAGNSLSLVDVGYGPATLVTQLLSPDGNSLLGGFAYQVVTMTIGGNVQIRFVDTSGNCKLINGAILQ